MLRDLRVKIRNRHSRISSSGHQEFLGLSKQFFHFVEGNVILSSIINELVARNPKALEEVRTAPINTQVYGATAEEAATIAYAKWHAYANQDKQAEFYNHASVSGGFNAGLDRYRDWYVDPLFDYLDEILEDGNIVLATLIRYKKKIEWYRRDKLFRLFSNNQARGESVLAKNMYEYLFDQGIEFHVEPQSASGWPDVVSLENSDHPFIGDIKIFDGSARNSTYLRKGLYQVYHYCLDYNESLGYLIAFNVSDKQLGFEMQSSESVPRFEYNHKTIFIIVIDIHEHEETASKRPIPETVTISAEEMVRFINEEESKAPHTTP